MALLRAHGINTVIDVRAYPNSKRNPQFNQDILAEHLTSADLAYHALPGLGGRRRQRADSINVGWRNAGFRSYADYMQTPGFWEAIERLKEIGEAGPSAIMCAEAVPWRCHRSLIADAMVSRGWTVRHILTATKADVHLLTPFARVTGGRVTYPAPSPGEAQADLFSE